MSLDLIYPNVMGSEFSLHIAVSNSGASLPSPTNASIAEQVACDETSTPSPSRIESNQKIRGSISAEVSSHRLAGSPSPSSPFSTSISSSYYHQVHSTAINNHPGYLRFVVPPHPKVPGGVFKSDVSSSPVSILRHTAPPHSS